MTDRVDWGDMPEGANPRGKVLVRCPKCGRSAEPNTTLWLGPPDARHPANVFVHGGVFYDHNPYPWVADLDYAKMLAVRDECQV